MPLSLFGGDEDDDLDDLMSGLAAESSGYTRRYLYKMLAIDGILLLVLGVLAYHAHVPFNQAIFNSYDPETKWDLIVTVRFLTLIFVTFNISELASLLIYMFPSMLLAAVNLLIPEKAESTKHNLEIYLSLQGTIRNLTTVVLGFAAVCFFFPKSVNLNNYDMGPTVVLFRVCLCVLLVTIIVSVERLLLEIISTRFHYTAYKHRIDASAYATKVLDRLNSSRRKLSLKRTPGFDPNVMSSSSSGVSDFQIGKRSIKSPSIAQKAQSLMNLNLFEGAFERDSDPSSAAQAKKVAAALFSTLQRDSGTFIQLESFVPYFSNFSEASQAFALFDEDGNGNITRRELRTKICAIYKERKDLSRALRDSSQVVWKLHRVLLFLLGIIGCFICAVLFGVNITAILLPFGTFFAGCAFIFGENARQLFQSIVFLFIMHPYDTGDRVYIGDLNLIVDEVGLLGTRFTHSNGQVTYIPHFILINQIIYNIRRSLYQGEKIEFLIDFETPKSKIIALKQEINKYLEGEDESRELCPNPTLAISEIADSGKIKMFLWLEHKSNWQDGGQRWARKTRFMLKLREIFSQLKVTYTLLPQRVIHLNHPPPYQHQPHPSLSQSFAHEP